MSENPVRSASEEAARESVVNISELIDTIFKDKVALCFCTLCKHESAYGHCYACPCGNHVAQPSTPDASKLAETVSHLICLLYKISREHQRNLAPVVAAAEETMAEKCAGAVCEWCRKGFLVIEYKVSNANGWFYHKPDPLGLALTCVAHPIRAIPTGTALAENSLKAQLAEAERKAYLKVRQALEGAGDAPIPEGVCSNEDQEEGFSDGVCCTLNLIWKAIASLEKSAALSAPAKEGEK